MRISLLDLDRQELCELAWNQGFPRYRGNQFADWIFHSGVHTFEQMTNPVEQPPYLQEPEADGQIEACAEKQNDKHRHLGRPAPDKAVDIFQYGH